MGINYGPDFVQQIMEQFMCRLNNIEVYLENIGVFSNKWEKHQVLLNKALSCLEANSFTVKSDIPSFE